MSSLVVRGYSAQECLNDTKAVVSKVAGTVSNAASSVGNWAYNGGNRIVVWLKDHGASALLWVKEGSKNAYYWTKDSAGHAYQWAKNGTGHASDWMKGNTSGIYNWTKQGIGSVQQHVLYVARAIKDGAATIITWSLHSITSVYEQAKPHFIAFARDTKQAASGAYQTVRSFIQAHPNEMLVGVTAFCLGVLLTLALQRAFGAPTVVNNHYAVPAAHIAAPAAAAPVVGPRYAPLVPAAARASRPAAVSAPAVHAPRIDAVAAPV
ncbi:MAG: hypothetical protein ACHQT8_00820 [Chlamydiales bacterium]